MTPVAAVPVLSQIHEHGVDIPVSIGPLVLRVVVLAAVPVVAGFALLRAFLPEPDRPTVKLVTVCTATAVLLETLLADGIALPRQAVIPLLAITVPPLVLAMSRGASPLAGPARRCAPWVLTIAGLFALAQFAGAWLGVPRPTPLHTGVIVALVGLSWLTLGLPRSAVARRLVLAEAAVVATVAIGGTAHAIVLRPPERSGSDIAVADEGPPPAQWPPGSTDNRTAPT